MSVHTELESVMLNSKMGVALEKQEMDMSHVLASIQVKGGGFVTSKLGSSKNEMFTVL